MSGDIVQIEYEKTNIKGVIEYRAYGFFCVTEADDWELDNYYSIKVIGNIYENPELLKGDVNIE